MKTVRLTDRTLFVVLVMTLLFINAKYVHALSVDPHELKMSGQWFIKHFDANSLQVPFSFNYGGKSSSELFKTWGVDRKSEVLDQQRTQHVLTCTDPNTGMKVRCVAVEYKDFPTVEWTVFFKNCGAKDTPMLENIRAIDIDIRREANGGEFVLHHFKGSTAEVSDFQPYEMVLDQRIDKTFASYGGRPTQGSLCYFNLEQPGEVVRKVESKTAIYENVIATARPGKGMIIAVGWPGQWSAQFTRDEGVGLHVRAGQETTHFVLHPGEEVRTPLIAVQFWSGDVIRAQNTWRRWMIAHNLPRSNGKLPPPQLTPCSSHQFSEMVNANEENQKLFVSRYVEEGLAPDYWWMDAGWYKLPKGRWVDTGTWEIDPNRFPLGIKPISDFAHSKGVKIIVWFEPERVCEDTWLWQNHPEWLLSPKDVPDSSGWMREWKLLDLGNPEAHKWLVNHIDKLLTEQGIDLYRQDFNVEPLWFWRSGDSADRQGITENFYVQGYLAYWDELQRHHPGMLIDSCASGGRRNDLETLRRAVPLLQSDYIFEETGQQCQNYILSMWIPYHGTGTKNVAPYHFWSTMAPNVIPCWDMRDQNLDYASLRRWLKQWREIAQYYYGDYYPLTPYSLDKDVWIGWQFHDSAKKGGMIQAFRRPSSYTLSAQFVLHGLVSSAKYEVTDLQTDTKQTLSGEDLMQKGLIVSITDCPGAAVLEYKECEK